MKRDPRLPDLEQCETLGLAALRFLAADGARLGRFLAETGIGPAELRAAAGDAEVLVAVLEHLLADESLLLVFAAEAGVRPERIAIVRYVLAGGAGQN
ncbi:MAG: DUF3572 domain-containing protein [Hyphomicrobiaceae bacterium]|nr:DUF3572 domain-containing protein [Hyphomicrobiaceae bacterium]